MMRFGLDVGPVVVVALPLFEEANRTRAFAVAIMRGLADRGIASVLPDLPGQGDSLTSLETLSILDLQSAYDGLVTALEREGRRCHGVGIRSGALLDALGLLHGRWHLAPQEGASLLRELTRIKQVEVGPQQRLSELWYSDADLPDDAPVTIAGNLISRRLLTDFSVTEPFDEPGIPRRVVRLATDAAPADVHYPGTPLWRRSEPGDDQYLAEGLAADIADWIRTCDAR